MTSPKNNICSVQKAMWVQFGIWCVAKYLLTNEIDQAVHSLQQGSGHAHG